MKKRGFACFVMHASNAWNATIQLNNFSSFQISLASAWQEKISLYFAIFFIAASSAAAPPWTRCLWCIRSKASRNSASPFLQTPAVGAFDRRVEGILLFQERIQLDLGGAASLRLGRPSGIPYRRRFDKPWTMLNFSRKSWKLFSCKSNTNSSEDSYLINESIVMIR